MSMITEQVERLRTLADIARDIADNSTDTVKTLREAADTIEQLAAIKTLEQEPCPDAISRQAAVDFLETHAETYEDVRVKMGFKASASLINNRNNLPPVNPQPKTGHWIAEVDKWGDIVTTVSGYKCSECGEFDSFRDKFCPNCGCRMVEPQESEG